MALSHLSDVAAITLASLRPILSLAPVSFTTAVLRLLHRHFGMALTRVARPPPLDARLHLPFVTSTHRPILGVTFAAESALVLPLLAGLHRYHTTRVASLLQHSHIYSLLTLTMIFSTPVLSSLMSPLSRTFIITSSKYRTLFAPHVTFRLWLLSAFIAPAHLLNVLHIS